MNTPASIDGYEIMRVLGTGGMATVYAAIQRQPRRTVALKLMHSAAADETTLRRFRQEIEILGRLRHPYIGQVFGAGIHHPADAPSASIPYFVMEYVPGARTITEYCTSSELSIRDRVRLMIKVCAGVQHGHHERIIHRDLKPGNILVDDRGEPKIIDYGVARFCATNVREAHTADTDPGRLTGTVQYMAPEQVDDVEQDLDARCDVYALGVVFYRMLTNRAPYELTGQTLFSAARIIRSHTPPAPSSIDRRIDRDLETIVLKALAKDRSDRYGSAGSLGRDLVRWLSHKPIHARRTGLIRRTALFVRRHRTETIAGCSVLLVIAAAATILLLQQRTDRRDRGALLMPVAPPESEQPLPIPFEEESVAPAPRPPESGEAAPAPPRLLAHLRAEPVRLAVSPRSGRLIIARADGDLFLLDPRAAHATPVVLASSEVHDAPPPSFVAAALTQPNDRLLAIRSDGVILREDESEAGLLHPIMETAVDVSAAAIQPSGATVVIAGQDLTLRFLSLTGNDEHVERSTRGLWRQVAFDASGTLLVAATATGMIDAWRLEERRWRRVTSSSTAITSLHRLQPLGADGELVVIAGEEVWWTTIEAPDHPQRRTGIADFDHSHDAVIDASSGLVLLRADPNVHVIDPRSGYLAAAPIARPDGRPSVAFALQNPSAPRTARERWLISGDADGQLVRLPFILDEPR